MTGTEIINIAADLLGYSREDVRTFDMTRAKNVINSVYSDLFYIFNESGFKRLNGLDEEIKLNERVLNDVMPYGIAMYIAETMSDGDNQQLFAYKYNSKRLALSQKSKIKDTLPSPI